VIGCAFSFSAASVSLPQIIIVVLLNFFPLYFTSPPTLNTISFLPFLDISILKSRKSNPPFPVVVPALYSSSFLNLYKLFTGHNSGYSGASLVSNVNCYFIISKVLTVSPSTYGNTNYGAPGFGLAL